MGNLSDVVVPLLVPGLVAGFGLVNIHTSIHRHSLTMRCRLYCTLSEWQSIAFTFILWQSTLAQSSIESVRYVDHVKHLRSDLAKTVVQLPAIYYLLKGRLPMATIEMHRKYGSVVRVMPDELSFDNAQAWEDIYGHRQGHANMHKDPIHVGSVDPIPGVTTLTMADDANHARQRRAMAYSFSQKALEDQEHIVQGYVHTFIQKLGEMGKRGEEFNMVNW